MKKNFFYLNLLFCSFAFKVIAQINITTSDVPAPEKWYFYASDTLPTVSLGNSSSSLQNWDMTGLVQHTLDTSKALNYSDMPNSLFSNANTILKQGTGEFYGYLNNSTSGFVLLGGHGVFDIQGTSFAVNQIYSPAEIVFNFPTTYNSSFTNDYLTEAKFYYGQQYQGIQIDSIDRKSGVKKDVIVDAWGTLTTPLGGTYNVLRVKETKKSIDTVMAYFFGGWNIIPGGIDSIKTTTYYWWANSIGTALVTATVDTSGNPTKVQWLKQMPITPPLSVNEIQNKNNGFCVYPNPSSTELFVSIDKELISAVSKERNTVIVIKNLLGETKMSFDINVLLNNVSKIDISCLAKGAYLIEILNEKMMINKHFIKE